MCKADLPMFEDDLHKIRVDRVAGAMPRGYTPMLKLVPFFRVE